MERKAAKLDHLRRIHKVLQYIELRLYDDLSLEQLAKVGCFSAYHFHRIFHGSIGEAPAAYIRRLRLERAAWRLLYSKKLVTELALDAGYETPSAFTKAFTKLMGCPPSRYRELLSTNINLKESSMQDPRIEYLEELSVLSVRKTGGYQTSAPEAWRTLKNFVNKHGLDSKQETRYFGIYHDNPDVTTGEKIRCDACCTAPVSIEEEDEVVRRVIRGGRYASFACVGRLRDMRQSFDEIFGRWYPQSGEILDESPCVVELFGYPDVDDNEGSRYTIHVPLES